MPPLHPGREASEPPPDCGTHAPLFPVVHEDSELLVINKPAGLVCHPTKGDAFSSLISRVRLHLGPGCEAHLINRLDRETSGLVVIAKTSDMARRLRIAWETRLVTKEYLAIVHGWVEPDEGVIAAPLGRDDLSDIAIKDCVRPDGARAVTRFAVMKRFVRLIGSWVTPGEGFNLSEPKQLGKWDQNRDLKSKPGSSVTNYSGECFGVGWPVFFRDGRGNMPSGPVQSGITTPIEPRQFSLLRVTPETGRKHQIRLHLCHLGYPVIGDKIYGRCPMAYIDFVRGRLSNEQKAVLLFPCQALHAAGLEIPLDQTLLRFIAPPGRDFSMFAQIDLRSKNPQKKN